MALYEMEDAKERVILVGVQENDAEPEEESLDELAELARTAGAEVAGRLIQKREAMHPVTYIGKGKILELKELLWETDATGIICDDELTSVQLNHLEEELECKIVDRTLLILDIFAGRAVSREGKIQVELAQLKYRAARLVGLRNSLSRLGGGIGTRGPGEKKLEMDRRLIRERFSQHGGSGSGKHGAFRIRVISKYRGERAPDPLHKCDETCQYGRQGIGNTQYINGKYNFIRHFYHISQ